MTLNKFLAIAFMCHQRPDRSFFYNGKQFPICARCTGILVGYFAGVVIAVVTKCSYYQFFPLLLIPMSVDGILQQRFNIMSNNPRRFMTGIIGGVAIIYCFICYHMLAVWIAKIILKNWITI